MIRPSRILIVDDEPFNVDYLEQELEDLGYVTVSARNGREALAKVHRLGGRYRVERLGREPLKNLVEAVDIYRVLGPV